MKLLWLLPLLLSCGAKRSGVEPAPPWATHSGKTQARTELARALLESGNSEAALRLIGQMHQDGSKAPEIQVIQGKALANLGLTDDAEAILTKVTRHHPGQHEAQNQLGILLMDQQRIDEAISHFRAASRAAPKNGSTYNNLGFALMTAGRHEEAVKTLRKAMALDGSQLRTRNNLGFALAAMREDGPAWRVFKAGADEATAHTNLALAQELRGDVAAARKSYGSALKANPDLILAREALKRLNPAPPTTESPTTEDNTTSPTVSSPHEETSP